MKTAISTTWVFNPAAGTLNLSGISGFNIDLLYEVVDLTTGRTIYDAGIAALGYSARSGTLLTLLAPMVGCSAGDDLQIIYDQVAASGGSGGAITATDGAVTTMGTEADAAWPGTGSATEIAILKGLFAKLGRPYAAAALGYQQITALSAVQSLTVPTGATFAIIEADGAPLRYRDDGTPPTASAGMTLGYGEKITYAGTLSALQFIQASSGATLNVLYYK